MRDVGWEKVFPYATNGIKHYLLFKGIESVVFFKYHHNGIPCM